MAEVNAGEKKLLTPFELFFPKMYILELGGFGPTAEIYKRNLSFATK